MPKFRPTATLAALVPAAVVTVGGFGSLAAARPPADSTSGSPVSAAVAQPAARTSQAGLRVAATRHYGQPGNASGFSVIIAAETGRAWAFGGSNPGGPSTPIAARWNGSTLTPSVLPAGLSGFINNASAAAANDVWAAGQYGRYVLHWNGQRWRIAQQWRTGQITGLTAISSADVWVFGTTTAGSSVLGTWHFEGTSWRPVAGLARSICRASAVSASDIWAIAASPGGDAILRFNGSTWSRVRTGQVLNGVHPVDILAVSSRNVWVAGDEFDRAGLPRLLLAHWNGSRWSRLVYRPPAWAGRLAPGLHGNVLLTATPVDVAATGLILHASPRGWGTTIVVADGLGSGVSDVALAPRTSSLWATGGILTRLGGEAAIWSGPILRGGSHPASDAFAAERDQL
jgi:hypothetical protein